MAQILETGTGKERYRLRIAYNWAALFNGDNSLITLENDGTPKEWDLSTGKKLRVGSPVASGLHRLSPDGEILVSVDNVCVGTSMSDGRELFRWGLLQKNVFQETLGQDRGDADYVTHAAISPNGATIALGVNCVRPAAGRVVLCELKTGNILRELDLAADYPGVMAFSPDGKSLVAASGSVARVWDASNGKLTRTLNGHRGKIEALAFDRTGKWLATASADTTALIWDMSK
jgi:WD40 repeat protein